MEVHSNPPASQGEETSLLAMVENWSPSEVEEKASCLLENAKKVLAKAGSSHEAKLDCICLMAGKLVGFVPIFELEDSLLCPLLGAVVEYLEEVLSMMMETEEENRVVFFSLVCTLVEQTEKVVRHCMEQECGVGEVPSLPRVLPKILINTFSFLGKGEFIATTDPLKAQVANCFSKVRDLLIMFLTLMEKIKMRTVLEDELDILVGLCFELVNFHEVLIPLDFKLTCMVWRVYVKLTSTHQVRLVDKLNLTMATEVISRELSVQMVKLRQMLENSLDEGTGKVMAKVMYMLKVLISLGSTPSCVGDSPFFLSLLLEMMSGLPSFPSWLPEAHRQKLEQEVMSLSVMHNLLTMAENQSFISFILNFFSPNHSVKRILLGKPFLSLQLVVQLLLQQPGQEDQLLLLCFFLLSSSSSSMEKTGFLEGRQVMGKAMTMVDKYTWVLTNLCSWVSTISQAQFYKIEEVLISVLLDSSSSPLTCIMVATITVEDLFYNIPTRRAALRSSAEEHNKIADVVTKYAIHNSGVGFALKKVGEAGVDVKTTAMNTVVDNIRTVYGPTVAKELLEFSMEEDKLKFRLTGFISNVNYNVKKMVFLLFINNRLVDSTAIKRAIEHVYASYLPKGSFPFIYLSLNIAPQNVDVNVHPTKHEVFFLHQDSIIERIQQGLEEKLLNSNASRTFYTQKLLPGVGVTLEMFENKEKALAAKDMVRTDANMQKMDKFLTRKDTEDDADRKIVNSGSAEHQLKMPSKQSGRQISLSSVTELRQAILSEGSAEVTSITSNLTFVGCVDRELALVQHSTRLYLANTTRLSSLLFRQIVLQDFGNLSVLRLSPPPKVMDLALLALEQEEAGWSPGDGDKEELAGHVVDLLQVKKEMLADYFSLEFEMVGDSLHLTGLPLLLDDFCPWFGGLPVYIVRLATEVDWDNEKLCFDTFAKETAAFYSVKEKKGAQPRFDTGQHGGDMVDWKYTVEHVVYPAVKKTLVPPSACLTDRTLLQVASLPDLYKVFERC